MRVFILIGVLSKLALARPDVSAGYSYGAGQEGNYAPGSFAPVLATQQPLVKKHFYLHAAPEEPGNNAPKHFQLGRPQKNYRVVFVKTPTNEAPKLSAEYAPQEEKTVIYVLAQKEPELNPDDISTPAPTEPSKPEVFFIRYKTPEEASLAQSQIQAQYDALGGTSEVSDEGTAPLTSVEGSFGPGDNALGAGSNVPSAASGAYLPPNI